MERRMFLKSWAGGALALMIAPRAILADQTAEQVDLEKSFLRPPDAARPHTWWHWMNGNISADGITRDLEAMRRVGIGGVQAFDVGSAIPKGPVVSLSPEWVRLMHHAASEAERLGLSLTLHNCPGWSSSGGPWVTPEMAMQQLVWSETFVTGGRRVEVTLPQPFAKLNYYSDAFVVAFPSVPGETRPLREQVTRVTAGAEPADVKVLTDWDLAGGVDVRPSTAGQRAYLQLEFAEAYEARFINVYWTTIPGTGAPSGGSAALAAMAGTTLEASDDGVAFRKVADLALFPQGGGGGTAPGTNLPMVATFPPTRARFFRLALPQARSINEIQVSGAPRVPDWPVKTNLGRRRNQEPAPFAGTTDRAIAPDSVIDLTQYMDAQGRLTWQAPSGNWTILRIGHTPTGRMQNASTDTGLGLEIDKFSREAMDSHFDKMFTQLLPALRSLAAKGMAGALIDSYEVGMQNWSAKFPHEFQRRRGYDLRRYMPAMTGRIVGSPEITERFLWDVRRAQADVIADNYWGRFRELCHQHRLISYTEPYGPSNGPFDEMQAGSRVDISMGEFWIRTGRDMPTIKKVSSIAHVFGKPVVGAESFTGNAQYSKWQEYPYAMKAMGDLMYTLGLNHFIFHRFAHQPHPDVVPGMTMGPWGFHFDRTNTWFEQARPWLDYAARCQHILRQGQFVADLLYFTGESSPVEIPVAGASGNYLALTPPPPKGHDYDLANAEALLTRLRIADGRIVLPDGMSYRVLVLPETRWMSLEVLRKLRELVEQGMWLVGPRPEQAYGLANYPNNDAELRRIAGELWGELNGTSNTERSFGQGHVFWGQPLRSVLDKLSLRPDFEFTARSADPWIHYTHRRVEGGDIYFVANGRRRSEDLVCTFRVEGKRPEFWDAATGQVTPGPVYHLGDGRVEVPLRLDPAGSVFVVFREASPARRVEAVAKDDQTLLSTAAFPASATTPHGDVTNNFTISVWVKPETDILLGGAGGGGIPASPATESIQGTAGANALSFVNYPPEADALYGEGHVASGLALGRNGVAVYERARGHFPPVLLAQTPISGWTHAAVVYQEGVPSLYLNGAFVRRGLRSGRVVHPGLVSVADQLFIPHFEGHMTEPVLFREPLTEARIRELVVGGLPEPEAPPALEPAAGKEPVLLVWQDGRYTLRDSTGWSTTFQMFGIGSPLELAGPWRVRFQANRGAPAEVALPKLMSLHRHSDPGVRYFSGTASYEKRFSVPAEALANGKRLFLDLGRVEVLAQVAVNGRELGTLWKPPFRVDITEAVRRGENDLAVRVTNLWPNRLIGDEQLPEEYQYGVTDFGATGGITRVPDWFVQGKPKPASPRVTFTTWKHYTKDSPLLESGLLGPVRLRTAIRWVLKG